MDIRAIEDVNRLSHAYIVSSSSPDVGVATAKQIAAMAVCSGAGQKPCGACRDCRKAEKGIHPDIILVERATDDKGKSKRFITVDQIRTLKTDALILPNEADRKVYIIRDADKMNVEAQNAALKLLEEPPRGVIIILCAENAESLLVTVRSRCKEIVCNSGSTVFDDGTKKLTRQYLEAIKKHTKLAVCEFCIRNDSISAADLQSFTECTMSLMTDMLSGRKDTEYIPAQQLMHTYRLMETCRGRLDVNASPKLLLGMMMTDSFAD